VQRAILWHRLRFPRQGPRSFKRALAGTVDSIRASEMPIDALEDAWNDAEAVALGDYEVSQA